MPFLWDTRLARDLGSDGLKYLSQLQVRAEQEDDAELGRKIQAILDGRGRV